MAYVTNDRLSNYYASVLRVAQGPSGVASSISPQFVTDANTFAYNIIRSKLRARGYSLTDIDQWDRREEFNLKLGTYNLLLSAANLQSDDTWPEKYNIEDQLDDVIVTIDGEPVEIETEDANAESGRMACYSDLDEDLEDDLP